MTREEYFSKLDEEHAFLYFHLKPMDEERHNKWINHIFYMIKQSAGKIFNDHEAQLKQRDEEIERLKKELLYYQEKATTNKIIEDCFLDL